MRALKSILAKAMLSEPRTREQLRNYVASRQQVLIEFNGKRYRPEVQRKP